MSAVQQYKCHYCTLTFREINHFIGHIRAECRKSGRTGSDRKVVHCGMCGYNTSLIWRLKEHVIRVHPLCPQSDMVDDEHAVLSPIASSSFSSSSSSSSEPMVIEVQQPPRSPVIIRSNTEIAALLTRELAAIAADSLEDTGMTEKTVQFFIDRFRHYEQFLYSLGIRSVYNRYCNNHLESSMSRCCETTLNHFLNDVKFIMDESSKPMRSIHTRLNYFCQIGTFVKPVPVFAKKQLCSAPIEVAPLTDRDIHLGYGESDQFVQFIPMRVVLKKLFEIPGFLKEVLVWGQACSETPEVTCFSESKVWLAHARQRQYAKQGSYFFPLHIYYDDFEAGNALGSHSGVHKLGGVYYSLPFAPPRLASKLRFIMLAAVFKSRLRSVEGNRAVFAPIIDELNFLYKEGINVSLNGGKSVVIQFAVGCIVGDNLGLNSMLGFTSSFNARRCCRICRIRKEDYNTTLREDPNLLRTSENVRADYEVNDPSQTGVVEACIWDDLDYFRLESNSSVDFMHDMFEGVARYVMLVVLKGLIHKTNCFTLSLLNDRIKNLSYGPDSSSKPMPISAAPSNNFTIRMSASEMRTFVAYFGLMVGHRVEVVDYDPVLTDDELPDDDDLGDEEERGGSVTSKRSRTKVPTKNKVPPSKGCCGKKGSRNPAKKRRQDDERDGKGDAAEYYKLYLLLNEVITLISQDSVSTYKAVYLADVIELFLKTFVHLSSKLSHLPPSEGGEHRIPSALQPKFHFLTHYPSMMMKHGPLTALSTFRFESKNKQLKTGLKNSFNNINTPFSAAKKEQYHLNYLFFHNSLPNRIDEVGKLYAVTDQSELTEVSSSLRIDPDFIRSVKFVNIDAAVTFTSNYMVCFDLDNQGLPQFVRILSMYVHLKNNETYIKGENYVTHMFSTHYQAYHVESLDFYSFHKLSHRRYTFPNTLVKALDDDHYVLMRNSL